MSQENVEVVRAGFEAWNAGDMDAFGRDLGPRRHHSRAGRVGREPGPFVGREAVLREFKQARDAWAVDAAEVISDFVDFGDRVVTRFIWRGKGYGPEASIELSCLYTVRNGKHMAFEFFWDHKEALEGAGLSE